MVRGVDRWLYDMTNNGDEPELRIARLERRDELDWSSNDRVLDLMDRHVAKWKKRDDSLRRERETELALMQREIDEFRDELRSIREERRRREDWIR